MVSENVVIEIHEGIQMTNGCAYTLVSLDAGLKTPSRLKRPPPTWISTSVVCSGISGGFDSLIVRTGRHTIMLHA